jgi:hypothetical protein
MGNGIGCSSVLDFWNYRFSSSSIVRILANETSFLNPQVDADGEKDKQAAQDGAARSGEKNIHDDSVSKAAGLPAILYLAPFPLTQSKTNGRQDLGIIAKSQQLASLHPPSQPEDCRRSFPEPRLTIA